jgi:hypothetical protein
MVVAAKGLQRTKPKRCDVAAMVFDVVDDGGDGDATFGFAKLAQWMCSQMVAPPLAPARIVIWAASIVAPPSRIQGMGHVHAGGCWHRRRVGAKRCRPDRSTADRRADAEAALTPVINGVP